MSYTNETIKKLQDNQVFSHIQLVPLSPNIPKSLNSLEQSGEFFAVYGRNGVRSTADARLCLMDLAKFTAGGISPVISVNHIITQGL